MVAMTALTERRKPRVSLPGYTWYTGGSRVNLIIIKN